MYLKELPQLKILYFFDPHYGENPICKIYNYQVLEPKSDLYALPLRFSRQIRQSIDKRREQEVCRGGVQEETNLLQHENQGTEEVDYCKQTVHNDPKDAKGDQEQKERPTPRRAQDPLGLGCPHR